jgi:hypothetical protein
MTPTDTDGLLRDAGGARPASDVDALIGRLRVRATKDIAAGWDGDARDRDDAAAALIQLRDAEARAYQTLAVYGVPQERARYVANGIEVLMQRMNKERMATEARIAALEAERDALRKWMLKSIYYIAMSGESAEQELCIVQNCAHAAGLTPDETEAAIDATKVKP